MSAVTMFLSLLLVKIITVILKLLPTPDFGQIDGFLSVTSHVANIFAWAQQFIPVGLILTLFSLTLVAYSGKFLWKIANIIVSYFK